MERSVSTVPFGDEKGNAVRRKPNPQLPPQL